MRPSKSARAAAYVRMSTENQNYSTDHQRAKIREYALAEGVEIVKEYVDEGKSGLGIKRRAGLAQLIQDVQSLNADFGLVIVFDVSRWGRFQDIDEAAYHEHTCRRAGIEVVYCAEHFARDSGPYAALMKSMKRVMAAEYSRELSDKVFLAQSRFVEMGFKQGGHAGYGLRRLAVKACGAPRGYLAYQESKAVRTDRVVLVWGPNNEVETVRRIYQLYLDKKLSVLAIVTFLNAEKVLSEFGRPWTQHMVRSILTNVKYCGTLAYNRRSCKLQASRVRNTEDKWVVNNSAIDPIIARELFSAVQAERLARTRRYSQKELVAMLRSCHDRHGKLSTAIIAADPAMPDPQLFVRSFGSLVAAYDAANLPRRLNYAFVKTKQELSRKRRELCRLVESLASQAGGIVEKCADPYTLLLNGRLVLRVNVAICRTPRRGQRNWKLENAPGADFVLTARLSRAQHDFIDYFLTGASCRPTTPVYLREANLQEYASFQHVSLESLFLGPVTTPIPLASTGSLC
ncbi:recombinase family protein [Massilia phyllosphaerae]|uniref:recombinase family protein n=1 Tax=Massilia phyllosphaerae TaxID=3106034 RepID=UPI002B1CB234|nr:recombinase family protein [Massilia sp. SGZ-792]